eukprot:CAMPEP_0167829500 /NCGR_PEP_ID=MMETSP0112_2-20121227/12229_1 /TAXON_ID=91324 /ORGANISM="Lotharella globosa, Strain CCCM811" /LENGTH=51 /DNA_ID=CAMNT_0007733271 /DNA_START=29 /DNA_END=181 /DNA_ORIENTATION=+
MTIPLLVDNTDRKRNRSSSVSQHDKDSPRLVLKKLLPYHVSTNDDKETLVN